MSGGAYYNEIDPYCAAWLRNLIAAGHIAAGDVDERSIVDVKPDDLKSYTQCHFFAGIGGWSYALRLAGWPDDRPVWTGSCPCQPFSAAGQGKAADDERHLWPAWLPLITERHPAIVFGEQVEAAIGWGWLDAVFADLEKKSYACGAAVLPACSVGAPHIRQRLWFVGHVESGERRLSVRPQRREDFEFAGASETGELADDSGDRSQNGRLRKQQLETEQAGCERNAAERSRCSPWADLDWLPCTDGKARPTKSGIFPLAHGVSARMGKLRAAGNAIVPQVAAEFIKAAMT